MGSEGLKDERDVYCLWNPSQEVEDYWDEQQPAIDRRLILQMKYEPRHDDSIDALRTMYEVLTRVPLEDDPFDLLSEFLEDSTFLTASIFLKATIGPSMDGGWPPRSLRGSTGLAPFPNPSPTLSCVSGWTRPFGSFPPSVNWSRGSLDSSPCKTPTYWGMPRNGAGSGTWNGWWPTPWSEPSSNS